MRKTKMLPKATRAAISRAQIVELEAKAKARRKEEEAAELAKLKQTLLKVKEREQALGQRRAERDALETKKAKLRRQILGR
jgi:hypothetical protein